MLIHNHIEGAKPPLFSQESIMMKKIIITLLVVFSVSLQANDSNALKDEQSLLKHLSKIVTLKENDNESDNKKIETLVSFSPENGNKRFYLELFAQFKPNLQGIKWKNVNKENLEKWFEVLDAMDFYSNNKEVTVLMQDVFEEMLKTNSIAELQSRLTKLESSLVKNRMFNELDYLKNRYQDFIYSELPKIIYTEKEKNTLSLLSIDFDKNNLKQINYRLPKLNIIVVSHPLCRFSKNAREAIAKEPLVNEVFEKYGLWLIPQHGTFDLDAINSDKYAKKYPLYHAWDESEWKGIEFYRMPNMYFLKDGKIVGNVGGWPAEGRMGDVKQALKKLGLLQ